VTVAEMPERTDGRPEGAAVLQSAVVRRELVPAVVLLGGRVGVSDHKLMGVLSALGHAPDTEAPWRVGPRCWWWFSGEGGEAARRLAACYYARWNGDRSSPAFVRECNARAKRFAMEAKALSRQEAAPC